MSDVTNALAKSKVAWLLVPPDATVPCWYAATGDTAYLVGGGDEQPLPQLPPEVRVILRAKETWAAVGPVPATVTRVEPGSELWDTATRALVSARQNNPPEGLPEHWAEHCTVYALDFTADAASATQVDPMQPAPTSPG